MQERHHVKTTPGEPHAAPEYAPHPVHKEEGGNVQMDDINIPLVAVSVAFFAALLAVTIVSLQAWFYNRKTAETTAKIAAQEDPQTPLGGMLKLQRDDLNGSRSYARDPNETPGATQSATASAPAKRSAISIDRAMQLVSDDYNRSKR